MKQARLSYVTPQEYLGYEQDNPAKHEYVGGQIYAMIGTRDSHNFIAGNVYAHIRMKMRGGPCRVFMSDVKVWVEAAEAFYYPDVFVSCDPRDTDPYVKRYPVLVVEVLSPSTEGIDRREKLLNYCKLESLREYVLIGGEQRSVEVYRRAADGAWTMVTLEGDDGLELTSVGIVIPAAEIYQDVTF